MDQEQQDNIFDDPVWEYCVATKVKPYIEAVKKWWDQYECMQVRGTGVFDFEVEGIDEKDIPPGLMVRITSTAVRSPIKNVQAFPFVPTSYLQIGGVPGGVNRMVERVCKKGLVLDDIQCVEKHNLPSTYQKGQFIAFIPKAVYEGSQKLGKYVYMTLTELCAMAKGTLPQSVICKCYQYAK